MDPIAYTAQIVAAKPAIEQTLPTPLGQDPYAGPLAGHEVNHLLAKWQRVADQQGRSLQQVTPTCHHHPIPGDLDQPQSGWIRALRTAGLSLDTPTLWILEGVLMYLSAATIHSLLRTVTALSSPDSVLGIDGVSQGSILAAQHAQQADRGRVVRHWQDDLLEHAIAVLSHARSLS